ncbi:MAG: D-alanyl-D-alanine carboxypeptidase family protein [Proteobacteria bacterium]|nr:D-alanyl-D-alanine carboxypeptidase family protein [Pseudomonadota bacterium]
MLTAEQLTGQKDSHVLLVEELGIQLYPLAAQAFLALKAMAADDGIELEAVSAFRTFATELKIWITRREQASLGHRSGCYRPGSCSRRLPGSVGERGILKRRCVLEAWRVAGQAPAGDRFLPALHGIQ